MQFIHVNAVNKDVVRSFAFVAPAVISSDLQSKGKFLEFQNIIMKLFSLTQAPTISYLDDEKENVQISSDHELALACKLANGNVLHVFVTECHQNIYPPILKQISEPPLEFMYTGSSVETVGSYNELLRARRIERHRAKQIKQQNDEKSEKIEWIRYKQQKHNNTISKEDFWQFKRQYLQQKYKLCVDERKKEKLLKKIQHIQAKLEGCPKDKKDKIFRKIDHKERMFNQKIDHLQQKLAHCGDNEAKALKIKIKIEKLNFKKNEKMISLQQKVEKRERKEAEKLKIQELKILHKDAIKQIFNKSEWLSTTQRLYLDGTKVIQVSKKLRNMERASAEQALNNIARQFGQVHNLALIEVCYDDTIFVETTDTFVVSSAKPQYESSFDLIVNIANQAKNVHLDSCLFVTNDAQLKLRLEDIGAKVIKPWRFLKFAAKE
jgi:hypothetical protein